MIVEIWSDFVCPFCYIGKRRFEEALRQFAHRDRVEVVYRSFELDPNAPRDAGMDVHEMLARKYGMTRERAIEVNRGVTEQAAAVGIEFRLDTSVLTNTFDAHRLAQYAATLGKQAAMTERLLKGYFTDALHLGDHETLADLAAEVGLDRKAALQMLEGGEFANEVRADEREAADLGVRGVPFFVIDRKYAVSGAQPSETFLQGLQRAWNEARTLAPLDTDGEPTNEACNDGVCTPPARKEK